MKKENLPQPLLDDLTRVIQSLLPVHSLYLLGANKEQRISSHLLRDHPQENTNYLHEFILLVISHKDIWSTQDFMDTVYRKTDQKVKVHSIHYTYEEVLKKLNYGDPFLTKAMQPENLLWQKEAIEFLDPGAYTYHEVFQEWDRRMARACFFQDKAYQLDPVDDETARMELLHQVVLHGCAALLWVNMQFRPPHFDLEVLLKLAKMVSTSPDIILPDHTYASQRIFQYLKEAQYNLHLRTEPFIDYEDTDAAMEKSEKFLKQVQEEGEAILKKLELGKPTSNPKAEKQAVEQKTSKAGKNNGSLDNPDKKKKSQKSK